jgi:hypothetical protein
LAEEARRLSLDLECTHQGRDDTFWIAIVKWNRDLICVADVRKRKDCDWL